MGITTLFHKLLKNTNQERKNRWDLTYRTQDHF